jgi:phosphopantetheinyl transferase
VDVECERTLDDLEGVSRMVLTDAERSELAACTNSVRQTLFFQKWVMKEAVVKATGLGLSRELRHLEIAMDAQGNARLLSEPGPWNLCTLSVPEGFHAALAYPGEATKTVAFDWSW